jgi:hypothetical protein
VVPALFPFGTSSIIGATIGGNGWSTDPQIPRQAVAYVHNVDQRRVACLLPGATCHAGRGPANRRWTAHPASEPFGIGSSKMSTVG